MKRAALYFTAVIAAWTLYALFSASQVYTARLYATPIAWSLALRYAAADSSIWALLTMPAMWFAGRFLIRRGNWWWAIPVLLLASVGFGVAHLQLYVRALVSLGYRADLRAQQTVFMNRFHADLLTCWALFGLRHGIEYYRRYRQRELAASRLEARLAVAQLEVLKMQLQPHFLFNTLHAISALMYRDVESADRMVSRLSDFLRLTLDSAGVQEVTLKREMEYLDRYLEIEQVRFGERVQVSRSIDPVTLDLLVPNLVLQPLVENAVRHGIAPRAAGGRIEITARLEPHGALQIDVLDDGPGAAEIREGVGIANTRSRIEQLYGERAHLDLGNAPQGGFRARLILPAHTEPMHESPDRG